MLSLTHLTIRRKAVASLLLVLLAGRGADATAAFGLGVRPASSLPRSPGPLQAAPPSGDEGRPEEGGAPPPAAAATAPAPVESSSPPPPPPPPQQPGPSTSDLMLAMGTSPRRIFLSVLTSSGIALGANFLGSTSRILSTLPPAAVESSGLDTYYPVAGYKRYNGSGYTLRIPQEWLADTAVELAKATRRAGTLDYGMRRGDNAGRPGAGVLPDAAFGPPGRKDSRGLTPQGADTNVSVVVSDVGTRGFTLRGSLGAPRAAAETLLRVSLAPEGSGRVATLLSVSEVERAGGGGLLYQFEYDVDRGERGVPLRAISVIGAGGGSTLITATVVAPRAEWESDAKYAARLRGTIESFRLKAASKAPSLLL